MVLLMETTKLIADVKESEKKLTAARESAKQACLATIAEELTKLKSIGFEYDLNFKNGPEKICSVCKKKGHNARGCPEKGEKVLSLPKLSVMTGTS